jgi:hypothetical protein
MYIIILLICCQIINTLLIATLERTHVIKELWDNLIKNNTLIFTLIRKLIIKLSEINHCFIS